MCRIAFRISVDWNRWPMICRESESQLLKIYYPHVSPDPSSGRRADGARSGRRQRASHDIGEVARQTGSRLDALKRALCLAAAPGFQRAPSAEGGRHAGGYLGVLGVERQHNIGDEI